MYLEQYNEANISSGFSEITEETKTLEPAFKDLPERQWNIVVRRIQNVFNKWNYISTDIIFVVEAFKPLHMHLLRRKTGDIKQIEEIYLYLEQYNEANSSSGISEIIADAKKLEAFLKDWSQRQWNPLVQRNQNVFDKCEQHIYQYGLT